MTTAEDTYVTQRLTYERLHSFHRGLLGCSLLGPSHSAVGKPSSYTERPRSHHSTGWGLSQRPAPTASQTSQWARLQMIPATHLGVDTKWSRKICPHHALLKLQICAPTKCCHCVKPLCFGVVCHTTTDNQNNRQGPLWHWTEYSWHRRNLKRNGPASLTFMDFLNLAWFCVDLSSWSQIKSFMSCISAELVCVCALHGALYKPDLWPVFSSQKILLTHTKNLNFCLLSRKTKQTGSGNTWFTFPHNSSSLTKPQVSSRSLGRPSVLCRITSRLFPSGPIALSHLWPDLHRPLGLWHLFSQQWSTWLAGIHSYVVIQELTTSWRV